MTARANDVIIVDIYMGARQLSLQYTTPILIQEPVRSVRKYHKLVSDFITKQEWFPH